MSDLCKYDKGEVIIRAATKSDMAEVAKMIQELAEFEKMPEGPTLTAADLVRDAFESEPPLFFCKIAELSAAPHSSDPSDTTIIGFAIYFSVYSTWEGRSLQLEDLCVRMDHRGRGVGARLFDAVAKEAVSVGSKRLDFHVLRWNPAREFYERRGAVNITDTETWCYYRLSGPPLYKLAE